MVNMVMIHPTTGAVIVSVAELKRFLAENQFSDDSPIGVMLVTENGSPVPEQKLRFPNRVSLGKGHRLPDMLILSVPFADPQRDLH
jgi:hypothetical protein